MQHMDSKYWGDCSRPEGSQMNILITGAGRGLGLELAAEALQRGHQVIAGVRDPELMGVGLTRLKERFPGQMMVLLLDVADEAGIEKAAVQLQNSGIQIAVIINNAAILAGRKMNIENLNMDEVELSFDINLLGPMRVVKHFLPLMPASGFGAILNISSEAGSISNAYAGDYPYAISKTALNMFSEQLRCYLKVRGIVVYSVHPGWMKTDMGGPDAPTDPKKSAEGIVDLADGTKRPKSRFAFIDYNGNAMPI
jgi:NAD(P)-dependent dehydrogenase (short-subunit alcohol dehydrogenase family)